MKKVLIYSNEHGKWWRPKYCGYTSQRENAGIFDYEEACRRYPEITYDKNGEDYFIDIGDIETVKQNHIVFYKTQLGIFSSDKYTPGIITTIYDTGLHQMYSIGDPIVGDKTIFIPGKGLDVKVELEAEKLEDLCDIFLVFIEGQERPSIIDKHSFMCLRELKAFGGLTEHNVHYHWARGAVYTDKGLAYAIEIDSSGNFVIFKDFDGSKLDTDPWCL